MEKNIKKRISGIVLQYTFIRNLYADIKYISDKITGFRRLKKLFFQKVGYALELKSPASYNQKVIWKKLNDRNPLLTFTADKFTARIFVKQMLGPETAKQILIPLLFVGNDPEAIPFDQLPENFIVKANHGSKMHVIVKGDKQQQQEQIKYQARKWLRTAYGIFHYEWAYRNIKPCILIEELLQTRDGQLPLDYKLYCFHGKCKVIRISENRFAEEDHALYYDIDWNLMDVDNPGYPKSLQTFEKPANLKKLIQTAELLSRKFDAVRIDLYNVDGHIYFGEFTHYDASGMGRFDPQSFDFELGGFWEIKPGYWLNEKQ